MTNEKISALIDQQASPRQRQALFDRMLADNDACATWRRYHLIGCVLRGEVDQVGADLSARIRMRLADEATVLMPSAADKPTRGWKLTDALTGGWQSTRSRMWQSAGALALAASIVAGVTVLYPQNPTLKPVAGGVAQMASQQGAADANFKREFGEMLAQHGEFTSSPGLNGLIVYAKLVSNEPISH